MKNIRSIILLLGLMTLATFSVADSFIRVINKSSVEVQAIWQAALCMNDTVDWEGDVQLTVCKYSTIKPGNEVKGEFGLLEFDRSVKVFTRAQGRVGYCNSMDYASVTITDVEGSSGMVKAEYHCP